MGEAIAIQTSEQGPPGPPGPAGSGITEAHGLVHPTSPNVLDDAGFTSNNNYIDLGQPSQVNGQLRITVGGIDLFGVTGSNPETMTAEQRFMLRADGVRVWFNDNLSVDNTDPILVTIPPATA